MSAPTAASTGASTAAIRRVLFVCAANICRSAYAEVTGRQERPVAVARTFSLGQLAALDDVPPGATGKDLLRAARRARATASGADDVADPYRRGRRDLK